MSRHGSPPHAPAHVPAHADADRVSHLFEAAMQFAAPDRGQAFVRKWVPRDGASAQPGTRIPEMKAAATLFSLDLLVSLQAPSGATAFDRLARNRRDAPPEEAVAIEALRLSHYRLLQTVAPCAPGHVPVRDAKTGEDFSLVGSGVPALVVGTLLFGRVVRLREREICMPGMITPLDPAAAAVARQHLGVSDLRLADAVYEQVVRHGTLGIAGLNRAIDADDDADDDDAADDAPDGDAGPVVALARRWAAIGLGAPSALLLKQTREATHAGTLIDGLVAATSARPRRGVDLAAGFERMLLEQMATVVRRERSGSGMLTLDMVKGMLDVWVDQDRVPAAARDLFVSLRKRVTDGRAYAADDPDVERLLQRIQHLRAKTVARGCTEAEALAAAEKVAELLDRHGLSLGELEYRAQPCDGVGIETGRSRRAPIDDCVPAIAAYFDCRIWVEQYDQDLPIRYVFFGLRGDVAAARYLYEMVERVFEQETRLFRAGPLYTGPAGDRRRASNSFQSGLARGIAGKLDALKQSRNATRRSASGRDLVPVKAAMVDDELEKLGIALTTRRASSTRRVMPDAYNEGQAAGERFEPNAAVTRAA